MNNTYHVHQANTNKVKSGEEPPPSYDQLQFLGRINYPQDVGGNIQPTISSTVPTSIQITGDINHHESENTLANQTALCLINWVVAVSLCLIFMIIYGAFNMFKYIRSENYHLQNQYDTSK
ncbi:hypothetical protein HCN44_005101 [Aphidius gifuensis]|uniref:Uncharacterized protein n=1 Tax=Aphidius gifuensis TaxID=684658 RepID=A0A834XUJ2_APHGI|nr:uncharacterized protein LOC122852457 [Aphidius gifuensis]KAF7992757.1 hypothetical protein HCN44_005101 [Aphidius gifuensis]